MGSWTRRITPRPGALIRDRDNVEENADIEIAQLFLMTLSIPIFNLFFFCIIRQIKKNHIKGGKFRYALVYFA